LLETANFQLQLSLKRLRWIVSVVFAASLLLLLMLLITYSDYICEL
jgi:hypothetical protein